MSYPSVSVGDVLAASDMNAVGLWLIETKTLTASAGPIQFNNQFTTAYDTYLLTGHLLKNTSTGQLNMQWQDASNAPITGANYDVGMAGIFYSSGVYQFGGFNTAAGAANIFIGGSVAGDYFSFGLYIQRPRDAVKTLGSQWLIADNYNATTTNVFVNGGFLHTLATAYFGCRLYVTAGTVTGKVSLYGYKS